MVLQACSPSTGKTEGAGAGSGVSGQPGLQSEALFQKTNKTQVWIVCHKGTFGKTDSVRAEAAQEACSEE